MKKKLQVHYLGLFRDLNWPFVIIFEKGTQLIEYPLRSGPISVFSVFRLPSYHASKRPEIGAHTLNVSIKKVPKRFAGQYLC